MTAIQFTLDYKLNASVQVGDILYFANPNDNQNFNVDIIEIGPITELIYPASYITPGVLGVNNGQSYGQVAPYNPAAGSSSGVLVSNYINANIQPPMGIGMRVTTLDVEAPWDVDTVLATPAITLLNGLNVDTLVTMVTNQNITINPAPIHNTSGIHGKFLLEDTWGVKLVADMPQPQHTLYSLDITPSSFLFFSKDNKANVSSMLGYYADIQFKNSSYQYAELFQIGAEVTESSK